MCDKKPYIIMSVQIITNIIHIITCYFLIVNMKLDTAVGSGMALSITGICNLMLLQGYALLLSRYE